MPEVPPVIRKTSVMLVWTARHWEDYHSVDGETDREWVSNLACLVWMLFLSKFDGGRVYLAVWPPIVDCLECPNGLLRLGTRSKKYKT